MTKFREILSRLKEAKGPDRELDGLIYGAINGLTPCGSFLLDIDGERFQFEHPTVVHPSGAKAALYERGRKVGEFTASIDAALALVEKKLPGWEWGIEHYGSAGNCGEVWPAGEHDDKVVRAFASTAPLAILICLFEALIAQEAEAGR